jgi:hypothetical protein
MKVVKVYGAAVVAAVVAAGMAVGLVMTPPVAAHHALQAEYDTTAIGSFTGTLRRSAPGRPGPDLQGGRGLRRHLRALPYRRQYWPGAHDDVSRWTGRDVVSRRPDLRGGTAAQSVSSWHCPHKPNHRDEAGGARRGRPARTAGTSHVTGALGAEHGWGCRATGPALRSTPVP